MNEFSNTCAPPATKRVTSGDICEAKTALMIARADAREKWELYRREEESCERLEGRVRELETKLALQIDAEAKANMERLRKPRGYTIQGHIDGAGRLTIRQVQG